MPRDDELEEVTAEDLSGPKIDRRTATKILAAAGLGSLAGCLGDGDSGGDDGSGDDGSGDDGSTGDDGSGDDGSTGDDGSDDGGSERSGGRLTAAWKSNEIYNLDPQFTTASLLQPLIANIFSGLVRMTPSLEFVGDVAEDWEVSDDQTTITFSLRDDVQFHNGRDVIADDVAYSLRRAVENEGPHAYRFQPLVPFEDGIEIPDDQTIILNLDEPFAPIFSFLTPFELGGSIVPQEVIEDVGRDEFNLRPVGSGPFQVTSHTLGEELVMDAYDNYHLTDDEGNQYPYLDGINVETIADTSTFINALRSGDVDLINEIPLEQVRQVKQIDGITVEEEPGPNWQSLALNFVREPFDSHEARMAIAKAIDNKRFIEQVFFGAADVARGPIPPAIEWAYTEDFPDTQEFDPEAAQDLIDESPYDEIEFEILTSDSNLRAAEGLQDQLDSRDRFDISLNQVPSASYYSGNIAPGDFDAFVAGSGGSPDPDSAMYNFFRIRATDDRPEETVEKVGEWPRDEGYDGVWNDGHYINEEVHELIGEQRTVLNLEERAEVLKEAEDMIIEDVARVFTHHPPDNLAYQDNIQGYRTYANTRYFHTVWLDE